MPETDYIEQMMMPLVPPGRGQEFDRSGGVDFSITTESGDRFRVNLFRASGHTHAAIRRVQNKIPTFEELKLPEVYEKTVMHAQEGLVLVSGVTGSGKSSTLAAMLDYINENRAMHVVTIEDPIEFVFTPKKCIISQREVNLDRKVALIEKKARRVRVGQSLKTINGAFHAIIYKSRHIMDIYLHRPSGDKIFVRRIPVALGKHGCTPAGTWEISSREYHPNYTPAPNSPLRQYMKGRAHIAYGETHYAFGTKGLWIALRGTGDNTRIRKGYGIHSTSHQDSIGKDASEGCIRVGDNDIELVYCLLYPTSKTATTPASTIDIRE